MVEGVLYGVGVGPGDPELLTLKAARIIGECPVVAVPDSGGSEQLALKIAREYVKEKEILHCYLPMTRDKEVLRQCQQEAADQLCRLLKQGQNVAFLTLGDPSVYATYSYMHRLVEQAGFEVRIVPGITSFCAAAAALGEPLCEGDQPLHILPAAACMPEGLELPGVKVVMKMGRKRDEVVRHLQQTGRADRAVIVERCTLPEEAVYRDLERLPEESGYFSLLVVGEDKE